MNLFRYIFAMIAVVGGWTSGSVAGVDSPVIGSKYGQIQNVQNYSSNPFWSPDGGYRQGMPVPVYVTGPDLSTSDCTTAVSALIAAYCGQNNQCFDMNLSDVRPVVILQLSRLPGHNYATSCIGYIDSEFDNYVRKNQVSVPNHTVEFPKVQAVANPGAQGNDFKIELPQQPVPEWMQEMQRRKQELKQLQNGD